MDDKLSVLKQNPLIDSLGSEHREKLLRLCSLRQVEANTTIYQQGDPSHDIFLIVEGTVTLSRRNRQDREFVLARLQTPDIFGEIEWLDQGPRILSAKADSAATLLVLDAQQLHSLQQQCDPLATKLLHLVDVLLSQRLRSLDRQMVEAMLDPSILAPPQPSADGPDATPTAEPDRNFFHGLMAGLFTNARDRLPPP